MGIVTLNCHETSFSPSQKNKGTMCFLPKELTVVHQIQLPSISRHHFGTSRKEKPEQFNHDLPLVVRHALILKMLKRGGNMRVGINEMVEMYK